MRLSTYIKHKYEKTGVIISRAIQDDCLVRLTVPVGTPHLQDEVKRTPAGLMIGGLSKTRLWVWVWSGAPDWEDNLERTTTRTLPAMQSTPAPMPQYERGDLP
jgi:hypothetical protein